MSVDRKFGTANTHKPDIKHFAARMRIMVSCDSHLERKKCVVVDLDKSVIWYMTQPDTTYFEFDDGIHGYTPDFLIKTIDGYEFWEMKPFFITLKEEFIRRHKALKAHFKNVLKVPLKIVTEKGLTKREFIANCQQLSAYINHYQDDGITHSILADIQTLDQARVIDAENISRDYGQSPDYAWAMMANKHLTFSNELLLKRNSLISSEGDFNA
jgi:hypothetical protein